MREKVPFAIKGKPKSILIFFIIVILINSFLDIRKMDYDEIINLGLNRGDPIRFDLSGGWTSSEEITGTFSSMSKTEFRYNTSGENFYRPIEKINNLVKITESSE